VVALNFDMHYHFDMEGTAWRPYAGAGIGLNFIEFDEGAFSDQSDTEVGGNLIIGAGIPTQSGNRFFGEMKFGLGDIPTLKLLVGWNFKM
jgi:outer membrane protein W